VVWENAGMWCAGAGHRKGNDAGSITRVDSVFSERQFHSSQRLCTCTPLFRPVGRTLSSLLTAMAHHYRIWEKQDGISSDVPNEHLLSPPDHDRCLRKRIPISISVSPAQLPSPPKPSTATTPPQVVTVSTLIRLSTFYACGSSRVTWPCPAVKVTCQTPVRTLWKRMMIRGRGALEHDASRVPRTYDSNPLDKVHLLRDIVRRTTV
ncbi:hypothetical protein HD554DRAFT_2104660, partial [Boletus coccyginus]